MRFRLLGAPFVCALSFGIASGCSQKAPTHEASQDSPKTASATQAIQGGTDDGAAHPFAVGVCAGTKGSCQGFCSGALILPNVVITARHCVENTPKTIDCDANPPIRFGASEGVNWITTNNKMNQGTLGWHQVSQILVPTDDRVCGHDIAIIVLQDLVPASEAVPIIPGVQYPMGDVNRYSHSFTAIGYGNTSPQGFSAGTRRIRQNIGVLCIPDDEFLACPVEAGVNPNEFVGGDGTCEGDSGSSAYETQSFQKGAAVSFGVLSRGGKSDDGLTCKQSVYTRLDKWRDFVVAAAATASDNWSLYPKPVPDWTVYVPPPPDAGPPEAGPPKKVTNLEDGVACDDNSECASKVCADTGAGKACTIACEQGAPANCYEGMICNAAGICVLDLGGGTTAAAAPASTTTEGCSIGFAGSRSGWGLAGVAAAVGLALAARRRSKRRPIVENH
jgi:hypothetical protein